MKQRISIDQLKPGMYVTAIKNVSWLKHPFIRNKHLIKNEDEVQALKDCGGCEISIDTAIGDDLDPDQPRTPAAESARAEEENSVQAPSSLSESDGQTDKPVPELIDGHGNSDSVQSEAVVQFFDVEQALSNMDGDEELLRETVELFLKEYPKILVRLHTALADTDAKTLEREAHSIKGAAANLGATAAYEAAFRLEQIGRAENWGRAPDALTALERELKRLEKALFGFRQQKERPPAQQTTTPSVSHVSTFSPYVVVVDKLHSTRETLCGRLRRQGITNIRQVEDGAGALEALKSSHTDLVIADWNLSGMTGIELLRTIRGDEKLKAIPFLLVTGSATRAEVLEAAQAGVSGYLLKPFTADILADQLKKVFQKHPVRATA